VFKAVEHGDFDAGALHINTFEELNHKNQQLRVLWTFDNVGKPWIARAALDPTVQQALRTSLLKLTDAAALAALKVSGFLPARDRDYLPVRNGMKMAEQFMAEAAAPEPAPAPTPAPIKGP
jgi:ABC-type phosphate/phosphonate transport system substrate-binding protein